MGLSGGLRLFMMIYDDLRWFKMVYGDLCLVFSDDESNGKRVLSTNAYHKFLWQPIGNKVIMLL